jgi:Response regulator receiver domain/Histidine kinase-, DNA gyrase B-, and HSP90-like ATPase
VQQGAVPSDGRKWIRETYGEVNYADPAQFGSALLNLVGNAWDAMPSGGALTIRTWNFSLNGAGMPPEVLEMATDPFLTTKEPGKGTGLGLSQEHGFVTQSGGFLTLESKVGSGTTVRIHLPSVAATAAVATSPDSPTQSAGGTVLVVEDEPDVRNLVLAQLENLGYATLAATNGPEALNLLQEHKNHVELLLTDVVMPGGMTGVELIRAVTELRPGSLPSLRLVILRGTR